MTATKNKVGRPTVYSDETPEIVRAYARGGYETHGHLLPTVEGLAEVLGVTKQTLHNWLADTNKSQFIDAFDELKSKQCRVLIEKGLVGEYNSTITKLMLSHNHNIIEKRHTEITGADGGPVVTSVERVIVRPKDTDG